MDGVKTGLLQGELLMARFTISMLLSLGVMCQAAYAASAQDYPNKPIRLMTSEPGGGNDFVGRLIAQGISASLGQQVIVDNRSGTYVVGNVVAKAPADGYTLAAYSNAFWYGPVMETGAPYDTLRDFAPVTIATMAPNILLVHPGVPAKSVRELIALAKAKPGELNYGSGVTGIPGEMFRIMADVNMVRIPFKGSGPAITALISGQVQLMIATAATGAPHYHAGKVRGLAVTSAKPSVLFPGLPPLGESLPGYEATSMVGVFVPAKTPKAVINRLNQEIVRFINTAAAREKLLRSGTEPVGSSPEEFSTALKEDIARIAKLAKDGGLRSQ
jgi:tripartite-type tricarboxylate transporter receptor subunit TctC